MPLTNEAIVQMVKDKLEQKNKVLREQEKKISALEKELNAARQKVENGENMILTLEEILKNDNS